MRFDGPPITQQPCRAARIALCQQLPDAGGGIGRATLPHFIDDADAQAFRLALIGKDRRIAAAPLAETEIIACNGMDRMEPVHQHVQHEFRRELPRHLFVEGEGRKDIDA